MASNNFNLEIISPEGQVFAGPAESVTIPTYKGEITVLPHHAQLFTKLSEGEVRIKQGGRETTIVIAGGFLEVKNSSVHILSDYAIRAESIQMAKAEERKRQAEEKLKQKLDNREFTVADKDLRLSILELKVAQKIRHRARPT